MPPTPDPPPDPTRAATLVGCATVVGIAAVTIFAPHHAEMATIHLLGFGSMLCIQLFNLARTHELGGRVEEVRHNTNSLTDQLVRAARAGGEAAGRAHPERTGGENQDPG